MKLKINTILVNFTDYFKSFGKKQSSHDFQFHPCVSWNIFAQTFFYWGKIIYLTNFTSLSIFKCTFSGTNGMLMQASPLPPEFFSSSYMEILYLLNTPSPPPPPNPGKHLFYVPFLWIWLFWVSHISEMLTIFVLIFLLSGLFHWA